MNIKQVRGTTERMCDFQRTVCVLNATPDEDLNHLLSTPRVPPADRGSGGFAPCAPVETLAHRELGDHMNEDGAGLAQKLAESTGSFT